MGEQRLRELIQNIPDYAIFRIDAQGFITEWPEGAQRVKGYTPEEAIGQHLALFYTPEERAAGEPDNELRQAARTGRVEREGLRIRQGGERFWVNEIATAIHDANGHLVGFTKISRDITARKQAESALAQSERFVKGMITSLPVVVYIFDLHERRNLFLSPQVETLFGYTVADMQTSGSGLLSAFFHPDDLPRIAAYFDTINTSTDEQTFSLECRIKHRERGWIWVQCRDLVYGRDADGRPTQLLGTAEDINERKETELALRESEEHFRLTIEAAQMGTWDWNLVTDEVIWNEQHFRLFGMEPRPNPVHPDVYFAHVQPAERERVGELLQEAIASRGVFDTEFCAVLDDGTERWMSGYGRVVEEANGKATRMSGVMFDIDKRKRAEDGLRQADRRKDEFLALLAHELRNPLATLHNTLVILQLTGGKGENMTLPMATTLMDREVAHLVRLVDDLLDVSRISRGQVSLSIERIDIVALVREALEAAQTQYRGSGRALTASLPDEPTYLNGDAARLKQVVSNLLNNALKFTHEGGHVWLNLERLASQAVLWVRDDGIGIPAHELERIFEMFVQVDNSLGRSQGGLGLGLTLVHELVSLHGGRVEAQSAGAGRGSEFIVYLPVEPTNTDAMQPTPMEQPSFSPKRRVLVVDDNQDAATTLSMLLKLLGNEVYTRYDGQAGIEAAESLRPQVILLDISMPGLDGYQTCRLIREQPWGKAMTLIALSGYGQAEDNRRSQEAGFDLHLVKPVDMAALNTLLLTLPG